MCLVSLPFFICIFLVWENCVLAWSDKIWFFIYFLYYNSQNRPSISLLSLSLSMSQRHCRLSFSKLYYRRAKWHWVNVMNFLGLLFCLFIFRSRRSFMFVYYRHSLRNFHFGFGEIVTPFKWIIDGAIKKKVHFETFES